jgi:adenylate cyclase
MAAYHKTLGTVYADLGESERARYYLRRSLRLFRRLGDQNGQASAALDLAKEYERTQPDTAAQLLRHALTLARRVGDDTQTASIQLVRGELALAAGSPDSAEAWMREALRIQRAQNNAGNLAPTLAGLGAVAAARRQWPLALTLTQQALQQAQTTGTPMQSARIERQISQLYEATNAPGPALLHYQRHIVLRDSVRADQTQRRILRQRLTADAAQREAILRAEQVQNRLVAAAEIRRQRLLRNASVAGALALLLVAALLAQRFRASQRARRIISLARETAEYERDRADALLLNILPADTAAELKATGRAQARHHAQATVLFSDVVGFTQLAERLAPEELVSALDTYFSVFDALCEEFQLEKIKTVGDAYLLAGGLHGRPAHAPTAVVRCGLAVQAAAARLAEERAAAGLVVFQPRIGIHTGPVVAGVVGSKKFAYDIWGDTVNTAARMEQSSTAERVNISEATYQFVHAAFRCTPRGRVAAKNKGEIAMYFVDTEQPAPNP